MLQGPPNPAASASVVNSQDAQGLISRAVDRVASVLWGNGDAVETVLCAVLANGHVLLEDIPGGGKTTLARAVAKVLSSSFARIQFTSDMLPSDVVGVQVLDSERGNFRFRPGPIMHELVLADEINRASPKTQSAMLEAMGEGAITIDDQTYALPKPFIVIATENPYEHHGAYPLPESQLDRFMCSLAIGYPPADAEKHLLKEPHKPQEVLAQLEAVMTTEELLGLQHLATEVELADVVAEYILTLIQATREHADVSLGCSPRGGAALASMVRARALMQGRNFVIPDDVQDVAPYVLAHRLVLRGANTGAAAHAAASIIREIIEQTPVPR